MTPSKQIKTAKNKSLAAGAHRRLAHYPYVSWLFYQCANTLVNQLYFLTAPTPYFEISLKHLRQLAVAPWTSHFHH
jgi:hypothetical protein